jgi:hypothetical protein
VSGFVKINKFFLQRKNELKKWTRGIFLLINNKVIITVLSTVPKEI